jgi:hypothetical protein
MTEINQTPEKGTETTEPVTQPENTEETETPANKRSGLD